MTPAQFRRSMSAGIAFVVLFVVGVFVTFANTPDISKDSDAVAAGKYVDQLSDSGHRTGLLIGGYLIILAALAFVWFSQGLRARLTSTPAGRLVAALGVLGAAAMTTGAMVSADIAGSISFGDNPVPKNGDAIRIVMDMFFPFLFVVFGLTSAALIATIAVRGRESGLATWIVYSAWLGVLGSIFAVFFLPMVLALLWYLAIAIIGLLNPQPAAEAVASA